MGRPRTKPPKYWFWADAVPRHEPAPAPKPEPQFTLCDYCKEPFGFWELMTRIEHGPGEDCDLVHAKCATALREETHRG